MSRCLHARTAGFSGLAPEFAPAKWRWFQPQEPATWARVAGMMTLSDYFTFALTGEAAGDASTAAFTGIHGSMPAALLAMGHSDRVVTAHAPGVAVYVRALAAAT